MLLCLGCPALRPGMSLDRDEAAAGAARNLTTGRDKVAPALRLRSLWCGKRRLFPGAWSRGSLQRLCVAHDSQFLCRSVWFLQDRDSAWCWADPWRESRDGKNLVSRWEVCSACSPRRNSIEDGFQHHLLQSIRVQ